MDNTRPFWARKYGSDPKYSGFSRLTEQDYIGIGWPYAGDVTQMRTVHQIEAILKETTPPEEAKDARRDAEIVHKFVNIVQEGDLVACHDQNNKHLHIGYFVGNCIYDETIHNHFHLLRRVEWINHQPISLYPGIKQMLDLPSTFWRINHPLLLLEVYNKFIAYKTRVNKTGE